ncbi:HAD-IB family hydrolase [Clostridium saccharobutylicum]|uniref:phosphoserine phosphatase n=1 Tax=Clostridium saccharobutylicum DSM 13864 TaxID=1345695 RepID=U5MN85_CLOSA|nr:HAD-IB family hydrolase [Clostridium saccharobutylicum]AGX42269.1 HAD-superfamily subfamily IB hydrolase [Clostridium saccharobutylicum DSM 13864]AQR89550.1 haloacid dehalogenase-like hydrolase [Clostridium saccharobutylicum]AQR99452.1 haloacid dehalogenase-like hydrolase [Clostridium saccharobutylicum]AQS09184.1 haloacid dehalogenase-like hydrolase [Clostridium saccharobutylicum]AQS13438.1 haloacid dehalogenase-like hydrolase [Clostridium saccharobutylicum]
MSRIGAFFDLDGTLYREGLITEVFKKMVKYEIIGPERWYNDVRQDFMRWDRRQGDYDDYLLKMVDIYVEAIKGLQKYRMEYIAKKIVEQKGDRVYTFTRDRIKWHKDNNHVLIIISGSPSELVGEMAKKYGFTDHIGAQYTVDENCIYTGDVTPMWDSISKEKAINNFVKKYDIDLQQSYAYGDTAGDYTMFKKVRHPYCMNPTKELLQKVIKDRELIEKVNVIVERKDVIYNLDIEDIQFL